MLATRLHSRRARERRSPRTSPFINWTVLTGLALGTYAAVDPAPADVERDPRLPRLRDGLRGRLRPARVAERRRPAVDARDVARRARPDVGRPAPGGPAGVLRPGRAGAGRPADPTRRGPADGAARRCAGLLTLAARRARLGRWLGRHARACSCSWPCSVAATGGVFAAMILGHWYLVTPKLPEAPLHPAVARAARRRRRPARPVRGLGRRRARGRPAGRRSAR